MAAVAQYVDHVDIGLYSMESSTMDEHSSVDFFENWTWNDQIILTVLRSMTKNWWKEIIANWWENVL